MPHVASSQPCRRRRHQQHQRRRRSWLASPMTMLQQQQQLQRQPQPQLCCLVVLSCLYATTTTTTVLSPVAAWMPEGTADVAVVLGRTQRHGKKDPHSCDLRLWGSTSPYHRSRSTTSSPSRSSNNNHNNAVSVKALVQKSSVPPLRQRSPSLHDPLQGYTFEQLQAFVDERAATNEAVGSQHRMKLNLDTEIVGGADGKDDYSSPPLPSALVYANTENASGSSFRDDKDKDDAPFLTADQYLGLDSSSGTFDTASSSSLLTQHPLRLESSSSNTAADTVGLDPTYAHALHQFVEASTTNTNAPLWNDKGNGKSTVALPNANNGALTTTSTKKHDDYKSNAIATDDSDDYHARIFRDETGFHRNSPIFQQALTDPDAAVRAKAERRGRQYRDRQDKALAALDEQLRTFPATAAMIAGSSTGDDRTSGDTGIATRTTINATMTTTAARQVALQSDDSLGDTSDSTSIIQQQQQQQTQTPQLQYPLCPQCQSRLSSDEAQRNLCRACHTDFLLETGAAQSHAQREALLSQRRSKRTMASFEPPLVARNNKAGAARQSPPHPPQQARRMDTRWTTVARPPPATTTVRPSSTTTTTSNNINNNNAVPTQRHNNDATPALRHETAVMPTSSRSSRTLHHRPATAASPSPQTSSTMIHGSVDRAEATSPQSRPLFKAPTPSPAGGTTATPQQNTVVVDDDDDNWIRVTDQDTHTVYYWNQETERIRWQM